MGRSQEWSALGFRTTHMGFFLFINSFYVFSILSLKTAVSLSSLSHLPVISDFHVLIYRSELQLLRAEPKVIFWIWKFASKPKDCLETVHTQWDFWQLLAYSLPTDTIFEVLMLTQHLPNWYCAYVFFLHRIIIPWREHILCMMQVSNEELNWGGGGRREKQCLVMEAHNYSMLGKLWLLEEKSITTNLLYQYNNNQHSISICIYAHRQV